MEENPKKWKRFNKQSFNRKNVTKRAKKVEGATLRHARKFLFQRLEKIRDVRRHVITWLVLVTLLIAGAGLQIFWFQRSYMTTAAAEGGTYAEGVLGPVETLNPLFAVSSAEQSIGKLVFSSLLTYDTSGSLNNDLAERVQINPKGTEYTVTLKPDARWHDGARVTAQDVEFTLKLLKDPATRTTLSGYQGVEAKVIDDKTIQFLLASPYAAFSHALTFPILPKHILGDVSPAMIRQNAFSKAPIGSGPFAFRLEQKLGDDGREVLYLGNNESYYRGSPKLNRFQLHVYPNRDAILNALQSGEVNGASDLSAENIKNIDANRYDVTATPVSNGVYAFLNVKSPPLADANVRKALRFGTDLKALRNQLADTKLQSNDLPFVNGQLTPNDLPTVPGYNQAEAAKLLTAAGWVEGPNGRTKDGQPLKLRIVTSKGGEQEKVVSILKEQWQAIGVTLDIRIVDLNDPSANFVQTVLQQRDYDVLVYELVIGADPDVYGYWHSSQTTIRGFNFSNYSSSAADDALSSARSRLEMDLREVKYKSFAATWVNDVPAIGIYRSNFYYVHTKRTEVFNPVRPLISAKERYDDIQYWSVDTRNVYKTP